MSEYRTPPDLIRDLRALKSRVAELGGGGAEWTAPTLVNGFTNTGAGWAPAGYYKDNFGRVYLRGRVTKPASTAGGTAIFTLPTSFRPAYGHEWLVTAEQSGFVRIQVSAAGIVSLASTPSDADAEGIVLDTVEFRVV